MNFDIKPEELFIIQTFLQAYWISLLLFEIPFTPLILLLSMGGVFIYVLVQKYFHIRKGEFICQKLPLNKEIILHVFFFGTRILIATISIIFRPRPILTIIPVNELVLISQEEKGIGLGYTLTALLSLGYIDAELSKIYCFNPFFKIFEEVLNIIIVYCYILL